VNPSTMKTNTLLNIVAIGSVLETGVFAFAPVHSGVSSVVR
jgi:hypothetical protein